LRRRWFVDEGAHNDAVFPRGGRLALLGILLGLACSDGVNEAPVKRGRGLLVGQCPLCRCVPGEGGDVGAVAIRDVELPGERWPVRVICQPGIDAVGQRLRREAVSTRFLDQPPVDPPVEMSRLTNAAKRI